MAREPIIRAFFDEPTNTVSYLVADPTTRQAAVIDPVLDYDHNAGEVDTRSVEAIVKEPAITTRLSRRVTARHLITLNGRPRSEGSVLVRRDENGFARGSSLEGSGFEPLVPLTPNPTNARGDPGGGHAGGKLRRI